MISFATQKPATLAAIASAIVANMKKRPEIREGGLGRELVKNASEQGRQHIEKNDEKRRRQEARPPPSRRCAPIHLPRVRGGGKGVGSCLPHACGGGGSRTCAR